MKVPILQQPVRQNAAVVYFHTKDNPYGGYETIKKTLEGASRDEILCRAYGVPTKPALSKFPRFNPDIHVIPHETVPFIADQSQKVTHYQVIDPAGSKRWFAIWAGVTPSGTIYIWAEYPDISYGQWADTSKGLKGRPGDAAQGKGESIEEYCQIFRHIEDDRQIIERLIDPTLGAETHVIQGGTTSIIDEMSNADMPVVAAPKLGIEHGLQAINNAFSYDEKRPMSHDNHPNLYISDRCQNLVYCLQEYTALYGKDEVTKDPIDCLRYLLVSDPEYAENLGVSQSFSTKY